MGIKFSSIVFMILAIFIAKISVENFNTAQAKDKKITTGSNVER